MFWYCPVDHEWEIKKNFEEEFLRRDSEEESQMRHLNENFKELWFNKNSNFKKLIRKRFLKIKVALAKMMLIDVLRGRMSVRTSVISNFSIKVIEPLWKKWKKKIEKGEKKSKYYKMKKYNGKTSKNRENSRKLEINQEK